MSVLELPRPSMSVLSAPAAALLSAIEALAGQAPADLPGSQALAETRLLLGAAESLRAVLLGRLADVETRGLHQLEDAPSTASWVARQSSSTDRGEVTLARRLGAFGQLQSAVREGAVPIAVAGRLALTLARLRRHLDRADGLIDGQPGEQVIANVLCDGVPMLVCEAAGGLPDDDPVLQQVLVEVGEIACRAASQLDRLQAGLLVLAAHVEPTLLPQALERLADAVLPMQLEDRAEAARRDRGLRLDRNADGSGWHLRDGRLDAECGELLAALLEAERAIDPDNPIDTERYAALREDGWRSTDPAEPCDHPRSRLQRSHDALRNGLRRYHDSGAAGSRDKAAPHLDVTVPAAALAGAPGSLPAVGGSGATLPASLVRRWACQAAVTRYVLSLGHRVLAVSHTARTLTAAERRAKHLQSGGRCQVAGCNNTTGRLVPHHATPWAATGTTSLTDTVLLCEQSHHDLHTGQRTLLLRDGRRLGPDGWLPQGPPRPGPDRPGAP